MPCHIVLLDRDTLEPGETAMIQVRLEGPVVCVRDDRFVIRSYSPVRTLGGGRVVNPAPPKHKRFRKESIERIERLHDADPESLIAAYIEMSGFEERSFAELKVLTSLSDKALDTALGKLLSSRTIIQTERSARRYVHQRTFEGFRADVTNRLSAYHAANPLKAGMPKGELRSKFPDIETPRLFNQLLNLLIKADEVVQNDDSIRLTTDVNCGWSVEEACRPIRRISGIKFYAFTRKKAFSRLISRNWCRCFKPIQPRPKSCSCIWWMTAA
jgi:selenocysteine-specific elongation factor